MNNLFIIYLLFMYIGITFNLAGVMSIAIGTTYAVDTAVVGYIFSLFTIGYCLAILVNGFLLARVSFKVLLYTAFLITFGGIAAAALSAGIETFALSIFAAGVGLGVLCSSGNFYIVRSCYGKERTAKLNILNFFYSFGAIVSPVAAGQLLKGGLSWQHIYLLSLLCLVPIVLLSVIARFGKTLGETETGTDIAEPWKTSVYFIGAALFCYVVSEMILAYWIVVYLVESLAMPVVSASISLSLFWGFMAIGRLVSGIVAKRVPVVYLIIICSLASFLVFAWMLTVKDPYRVIELVAALGFTYSGLYASILSYGTMQVRHTSSTLMTFFVTVGSIGGILSFLMSSYLKQHYSIESSLMLSMAAVGLVCVFTGMAALTKRVRHE